jgi:hypothetical protein
MNAMAANLLLDIERVKREIDRNVKQHSDQPYGICSSRLAGCSIRSHPNMRGRFLHLVPRFDDVLMHEPSFLPPP